MRKPLVALAGRPNVGKSTLFNRLTGERSAIVADFPGVTRDRLYKDVEWESKVFTLVDTGGLFLEDPEFGGVVQKQVETALEEADVIIFVVDFRVGVTPEDEKVARILRKLGKQTVLAVNKVDNFLRDSLQAYEFLSLGLGEPIAISAGHGLNIDTLLDRIMEMLPAEELLEEENDTKIAVAGRPNVGKSSLINALLEEERVIVSDVPGTTRDAVDTLLVKGDKRYLLIDTSGIRRKSRISEDIEHYSVSRALRAIDRADVVFLILDANQGIVEQDKKIGGYIEESGKGLVILVNKWDIMKKMKVEMDKYLDIVREELNFLDYAPVLFISAMTGWRTKCILEIVDNVASEQVKRITTGNLNNWLNDILLFNPPTSVKGKETRIYYLVQTGIKPPVFVFFVNRPENIHFSYRRFLENQLRKAYGFEGTPIRLLFRKRRH